DALSALFLSTRETDVIGWYKERNSVGIMFTEMNIDERGKILTTMMGRVTQTLRNTLNGEQFSHVGMSLHVFPEEWGQESVVGNPTLYPDLINREEARKFVLVVKRGMDIVGSV